MADTVFLTGLNLYDLNILDRQFPEADLTKLPDTPHETFRSWLEELSRRTLRNPIPARFQQLTVRVVLMLVLSALRGLITVAGILRSGETGLRLNR
jgi:hypothetical protein